MESLFDESAAKSRLIKPLRACRRTPLGSANAPNAPGIYCLFLRRPDLADLLGLCVARGRTAAYVGVASSLRNRFGSHCSRIEEVHVLGVDDFFVASVPLESEAMASFGEKVLIGDLAPVFNGLGFGAKQPGNGRKGKHTSVFDTIFPGRSGSPTPSATSLEKAHAALAVNVARSQQSKLQWHPLRA